MSKTNGKVSRLETIRNARNAPLSPPPVPVPETITVVLQLNTKTEHMVIHSIEAPINLANAMELLDRARTALIRMQIDAEAKQAAAAQTKENS